MAADPKPVRYVTLAYGNSPGVYRQSLMLLVSLVAYAPEPYELVVATDRPDCYVWFGTRVEIEFLDGPTLDAWRGPRPFSMRQKLELARAQASATEHPTVLLDADVLATKPLDEFVRRLGDGGLFMHKREYVLSRSRRAGNKKLWRALKRRGFRDDDEMWNSGVIGLGRDGTGLIGAALEMYDGLGAAGVRHFATEQLVEGVILGRTGRLQPAEPWFAHYWGNKPGYDVEIARRLANAFIEGQSIKDAAAAYRAQPIELPIEVRSSKKQKLEAWLKRR